MILTIINIFRKNPVYSSEYFEEYKEKMKKDFESTLEFEKIKYGNKWGIIIGCFLNDYWHSSIYKEHIICLYPVFKKAYAPSQVLSSIEIASYNLDWIKAVYKDKYDDLMTFKVGQLLNWITYLSYYGVEECPSTMNFDSRFNDIVNSIRENKTISDNDDKYYF